MRLCPHCQKEIKAKANVCKYCHRNVTGDTVETSASMPEVGSFEKKMLRLGRETDFPEALKGHAGLGAFGVGRELKQISSMLNPDEYLSTSSKAYMRIRPAYCLERPHG